MINLLLFFITLVTSFVVVMAGAVAFHLTGLPWPIAKFQALSCFSGTGFTTTESETIVRDPQRRKIAMVLIVLGNIGIVALIATFANSLRPQLAGSVINLPFLHLFFPRALLPIINLLCVIVFGLIIYKLFTHSTFSKKIIKIIQNKLIKRQRLNTVTLEELTIASGGHSVISFIINEKSPMCNKPIQETLLGTNNIMILAIERGSQFIPNPAMTCKILPNDTLVCFGDIEKLEKLIQ